MKTVLKKSLSLALAVAMSASLLAGMVVPASASSIALTYDLNVEGENVFIAKEEEKFLVSFTIHRTDAGDAYSLFTMFTDIYYDTGFFYVVRSKAYAAKSVDVNPTQNLGVPVIKVGSFGKSFSDADTIVCQFYLTPRAGLPAGTSTTVRCAFPSAAENAGDPASVATKELTVYFGEIPQPTNTVHYNLAGGTMAPTAFPETDAEYIDYEDETPYYSQTVLTGSAITLPGTPERENYSFAGWSDGTNVYSAGDSYTVSNDLEFVAQWTAWPKVTLNAAGGTLTGERSYFARPGSTLSLPTPVRTDADFLGWTDGTQTTTENYIVGGSDVTLVARWAQHHTLTFDPAEGTISGSGSRTVAAGTSVSTPTPRRSGHQFSGWLDDAGNAVGASYTMPDQDMTLTAQWTENPALLLDVNDGSLIGPAAFSDEPNTVIKLPSPTRTGYVFNGWYQGGTRYSDSYTLGSSGSVTLVARWEACSHAGAVYEVETTGEWVHMENSHQRSVVSRAVCADCGESLTKTETETQACSYGAEWKATATGHVHECSVCGGLSAENAHTYKDGVCSVCGFKDPNYVVANAVSSGGMKPLVEPVALSAAVTVSGTTATVGKINDDALNEAARSVGDTDPITIDVSVEGAMIDTVSLPSGLASKVAALSNADGLTVTLTTGELTFNDDALKAIASAGSGALMLSVKSGTLASTQQTAVKELDVKSTFTVTATVNGKPVTSFNGGKATVSVAFSPASGTSGNDYVVYYVAADGKTEKMATTYANGKLTFTTTHFSDYVVAYEKPPVSFVDVASGAYYAAPVAWAVEKGITNGTDDTHFSPDAGCTRAQAVTFLYRAAGSPDVSVSDSFRDVPANQYYAKAVAWAVANGITNGTGDKTFSPDATCTRAQIVTFLMRYEKAAAASASKFADVSADAYYAGAVGWAVTNGITNGTGDNTFSPNATCTRAQIVTFLYRDFVKA